MEDLVQKLRYDNTDENPRSERLTSPVEKTVEARDDEEISANGIGSTGRIWWTVAGITILGWAFLLFGYVDIYPILSLAVVVLGLWGLGTILAAWQPRKAAAWVSNTLAASTLGLTIGAFFIWSYLQIITAPAYGTDEIAFDQYAAQLLHSGLNPYTQSMAPAFSLFHVSPDGYTFLLNGHAVTSLSYPALSFLFYVPFALLGWTTQMAVAVNVVAWAIGVVLAYVLLPRPIRPLAILVGSSSIYISYAVGGVTDALFVPLLIGAVYKWDEFPWKKGPSAWRGPVLLGLALAVKQTPWLVLPFLVAGIVCEVRRYCTWKDAAKTAARYVAIAIGTFLVPNIPFIVWGPHAWLSGVLTPIASHTVPAGQGLVGLSLFLGIGGGSLFSFTVALLVIFAVLWVLYVATYPALKPWAVLCPAVVLFFSARSFGSYLVTLVPATIVAACTISRSWSEIGRKLAGTTSEAAKSNVVERNLDVGLSRGDDSDPGRDGQVRSKSGRFSKAARNPEHKRNRVRSGGGALKKRLTWLVAGSILLPAAAITWVVLSGPPLTVTLVSIRTTGQLATVVNLGVSVKNNSDAVQTPAFSVESGGQLTAFWLEGSGPPKLSPGQTANYTLESPNYFAQPPISGGFQVVAFTSSPDAVSRSVPYVPTTWHVSLVPDAVNQVIPLGQPVTVQAQLLDRLNRNVDLANEPIYMGQVIYSQQGLEFGEALINQGQQGQTPVVAYTDNQGIATFTIRGTQVSQDPVYFEANLVNGTQYYPYGYSEILPIRFGS